MVLHGTGVKVMQTVPLRVKMLNAVCLKTVFFRVKKQFLCEPMQDKPSFFETHANGLDLYQSLIRLFCTKLPNLVFSLAHFVFYRVTDEDILTETAVCFIFFLLNIVTSLKGA